MRSPVDLLEWPYTFTQLPALMPHEFIREAQKRGVSLTEGSLEALHRLRIFTPLFRVRRDGRLIADLARCDDPLAWQEAMWQPTLRRDLVYMREGGRLHDPRTEAFIARRRLQRETSDFEYSTSVYLYSHHQLLFLPLARSALPHIRYGRNGQAIREPRWSNHIDHAEAASDLVIALSALEPIYYRKAVGTLSLSTIDEFGRYDSWRQRLGVRKMLTWLDVTPGWIKDEGGRLLDEADRLDPLGEWGKVVRAGHPRKWETLKGDARLAIDLRIGAELLLAYYDELVRKRQAKPLAVGHPTWGGRFDTRLKPQRGLDRLLTDFGLSPHPRLVLALEGATELTILPRVMNMFGIRTDPDFIAVHDAQGVGTDLGPLVAYAIAPYAEAEDNGRYLRLTRPPTRILVVLDPEGPVATAADREKRRAKLVKRIELTLPREHRTPGVRETLDGLAHIATWNSRGDNFEFAHFTVRQIARAWANLDRRARQPDFDTRMALVDQVRVERKSLDGLIGRRSKVDLAEELWPALEQKIRRAIKRDTEDRIPIVRILDQATDLAREWPRSNLVISLEDRPRRHHGGPDRRP